MQPQCGPKQKAAMAKQPGNEQPCGGEFLSRRDPKTVAMNHGNLPQQIPFLDGRILFGHAVAACDQKSFFTRAALPYDTMNKKEATTSVEHHIARLGLLKIIGLNSKAIARPQSR